MFDLKREEITGDWKKLHNKQLYSLYSSPYIITVIKSKRMRWAENAAHIEKINKHTISTAKPNWRSQLEGLGIAGRRTLK
jgi:hypothetical protein